MCCLKEPEYILQDSSIISNREKLKALMCHSLSSAPKAPSATSNVPVQFLFPHLYTPAEQERVQVSLIASKKELYCAMVDVLYAPPAKRAQSHDIQSPGRI